MLTAVASGSSPDDAKHALFAQMLPKIERIANYRFRHLGCPSDRADQIAETIALAWKWFVRLLERGKDPSQFPYALARMAARSTAFGRRLCGEEKPNDVLSKRAQRQRGFSVGSLSASTSAGGSAPYRQPRVQRERDAYDERLEDNTQTPIPDQVMFRLDFRSWLKTLTDRERRVASAMGENQRTNEIANRFQVTPGRISQMRRRFSEDWERFWRDDEFPQPAISH